MNPISIPMLSPDHSHQGDEGKKKAAAVRRTVVR
jgi:hypothetical protein